MHPRIFCKGFVFKQVVWVAGYVGKRLHPSENQIDLLTKAGSAKKKTHHFCRATSAQFLPFFFEFFWLCFFYFSPRFYHFQKDWMYPALAHVSCTSCKRGRKQLSSWIWGDPNSPFTLLILPGRWGPGGKGPRNPGLGVETGRTSEGGRRERPLWPRFSAVTVRVAIKHQIVNVCQKCLQLHSECRDYFKQGDLEVCCPCLF